VASGLGHRTDYVDPNYKIYCVVELRFLRLVYEMIFMNHSKECDHADYRWQIWAECHTRKVTILGGRYNGETFFDLCELTNSFFL